jgi:hypothetical protein
MTDRFVGFTIEEKMTLLRAVQEEILGGQVTHSATARGVETNFSNLPTSLKLQYITESILIDPDLATIDPTGKLTRQLRGVLRPVSTTPIFC